MQLISHSKINELIFMHYNCKNETLFYRKNIDLTYKMPKRNVHTANIFKNKK